MRLLANDMVGDVLTVAATLLLQAAATPPQPVDNGATARRFLEVFALDPSAATSLMTADAVMVIGDIGGTYSDILRVIGSRDIGLEACSISSLRVKPRPSLGDANDEGTVVEGAYSCTGADDTQNDVEVSVVVKNGRVAKFALGPPAFGGDPKP